MPEPHIPSPHDALVRSILDRKASAIAYLSAQLPAALAARIDWESLQRLSGSFITAEMRSLHSDFIFAVLLDGRPLFLYCLIEHQSRVEPFMRLRLLGYVFSFLVQWLRDHPGARALPPVVPMVLHTGSERWSVSRRMLDLFDIPDDLRDVLAPLQPDFEHLLLDLSQVGMDEIGGEIVVRTMLMLLKAAASGEIERWLDEHGRLLLELLAQKDAGDVLNSFLRYICRAGSGTDFSTVREKLSKLDSPHMTQELMTIADELMHRGRVEGRVEGMEMGLLIGRVQMLEEMLGEAASARESLAAMDATQLQAMEAALRARLGRR